MHATFFGIQVKPQFSFTDKEVAYLTNRIQNGGTEVVEVNYPLIPVNFNYCVALFWL